MQVAGHKQRPPLHPTEKWYLAIVLVQLIFMPWAFATVHVWSQLTALGLAALGMGVALLPRYYSSDFSAGGEFTLHSWPRLVRFPLFWIGAALLAYVLMQAANPSWIWERNATQWWLRKVSNIAWLPTSIDTPFERGNIWQPFIVYLTVWLTSCSLWIGITRRKALHILLASLVGNAVVLGMLGFVHRASGATKVLWIREFPGAQSFASFVYQNHAGAYFSLLSFVALGLAVWNFFEGRKRMARSTPTTLWLIAALLLVFAVVFSLSRGAMISLAVFGAAAAIAIVILRFSSATASTTPTIVPVMVAMAVLGTMGWMVQQVDFSSVRFRFEQLSKLKAADTSVSSRQLAREAATEMLGDYWLRGVGTGGFAYLFPEYVRKRPEIYAGGKLFWEHAHIDWLEYPIELGLAGSLILVLGFGWYGYSWIRARGYRHPVALMIALGAAQVTGHALIDFPFQAPAIMATWCALLIISLRWLELDGGPLSESAQSKP